MRITLCVALLFLALTLYGQCVVVPDTGTAGAPITFSSCDTQTSLIWSFGDGGQTSGPAVSHTYLAAGIYNWTAKTSTDVQAATGTITIVELPGGQCPFCPIDPPTAADTTHLVFFGICPDLAAYNIAFGNGGSKTWSGSSHDSYSPVYTGYDKPGVYTWSINMTAKDGQICQRTGRITIIGCKVTSLAVDTHTQVQNHSIRLDWTTNKSSDCHAGGDVKTVWFEIDFDHFPGDAVPENVFSRTIQFDAGFPPGYHVIGVQPIVCRSCDPCGGACGFGSPGYDPTDNEQGITVLSDPNCPPVALTLQISSAGTFTAVTTTADAQYDWYEMQGPHENSSLHVDSGPLFHGGYYGFYWVVATSPCGKWARSNLFAICQPPQITREPQSRTVLAGESVALVATAFGAEVAFHWYAGTPQNRSPMSGASDVTGPYSQGSATTTSSFQTPPLNTTQSYFAEARDACGNVVTSAVATLTVQKHRSVHH